MAHGSRDITPAEDEDFRLMGRACEGDVDAFAGLVMRHRPHVERFLHRLFGDRQKAEDGAQEVFLRLWMARRRYEPRSRFTTFLYQVAQNYWRDELRKARVRPQEEDWDEEHRSRDREGAVVAGDLCRAYRPIRAPSTTEPHYQLFLRYRQWQIRQAIARLPETHRLVFVLAHLEERRLAEIAQILDLPLGTVKSRLHTAARLLRQWLTAEESEDER